MLTRLHHVAVAVPSLEYGYMFFADLLGVPCKSEAVVEAQGVRAALLDAGTAEVELLEPIDASNPVGRFLARGGGLHHICYASTDVDADLRAAATAGADLLDVTGRPGLAGRIGFLHPRSTGGLLVEFAEPGGGVPAARIPARDVVPAVRAGRLAGVEAIAPEPDDVAARLGAVTGHAPAAGVLPIGDVPLRIATTDGRASLVGLVFGPADASAASLAARLRVRAVPVKAAPGAVVVEPDAACGVRVTITGA